MDHTRDWLRLQLTPGLGRSRLFRLIEFFGSPGDALQATADRWCAIKGISHGLAGQIPLPDDPRIEQALEQLHAVDAWQISYWSAGYPDALRQICDPPALLYGCGTLPPTDMLAIVGSRRPTSAGRQFAENLAEQLAGHNVTVVSGLARGIDAAAHRGALSGGGATVGILGCGIDQIYPPEHARLFEQVRECGAILSEYPPGTEPLPGHFPGRNRIISALSRGTLVIEAARNSGSLITAEFALEQGRDVMAVPGGVDHATSAGTNQLIKDGAHPVTEVSDILQLLWPEKLSPTKRSGREAAPFELSEEEDKIIQALGHEPSHIDDLSRGSGLTVMDVSVILLQLELRGGVEQLSGGRYIRSRRLLEDLYRTRQETD
jgi:DNA processing protein